MTHEEIVAEWRAVENEFKREFRAWLRDGRMHLLEADRGADNAESRFSCEREDLAARLDEARRNVDISGSELQRRHVEAEELAAKAHDDAASIHRRMEKWARPTEKQ